MYEIKYKPSAFRDMKEILFYICNVIGNKKAAIEIRIQLNKSIESLRYLPYRNSVYRTIRNTKQEYRAQIVKNYLIFYYVDETDKSVNVTRVLHKKRNIEKFF